MFDQVLHDFDAAAERFAAAAETVRLESAVDGAVTPDHFGQLATALSDVVAAFGSAQQAGFRELREAVTDDD
jgi:hypothetical protein